MYENSTIPMLDPTMQSMSGYKSIIINFDLENHYDYGDVEEQSLYTNPFVSYIVYESEPTLWWSNFSAVFTI